MEPIQLTGITEKLYPLEPYGYDDCYYMNDKGQIYNTLLGRYIKFCDNKKRQYKLRTKDGYRFASMRKLYHTVTGNWIYEDDIEDLPNEEWRTVVLDFNGTIDDRYRVSNLGRVKSYNMQYQARLLNPFRDTKGYYQVNIGGSKIRVHRLVALAFIPNHDPQKLKTVDHINANKEDNRVSNLQWLSIEDNARKGNKQELKDSEKA